MSQIRADSPLTINNQPQKRAYLCLTILGYRKPGMSEEDYIRHMRETSAPMTCPLMAKYGIKRWTQIHPTTETRKLMTQIFDPQMTTLADYDCFSQVVFESIDDYKRLKQDDFYKTHLIPDHEEFADTKKSRMTIGWIEEFVRDGEPVDGLVFPSDI
ncbi:Decarboxylase tpcK-like protein [Elsinoe fawcettii]|nr:Decarboxylase tpcK-like protein [Elsinoe fawcettii]